MNTEVSREISMTVVAAKKFDVPMATKDMANQTRHERINLPKTDNPNGSRHENSPARIMSPPKDASSDGDLLSGASRQSASSLCSRLRIFSAAIEASVFTKEPPEAIVLRCEKMAESMMRKFGFDTENEVTLARHLPMFIRPGIEAVAAAARDGLSGEEMDMALRSISNGQMAVHSSAEVRSMIEGPFKSSESHLSIQMSLITTLTKLIAEAEYHAFGLSVQDASRDASQRLIKSCLRELERLTPLDSSEATGVMILQSLIGSAGGLYAQIWRSASRLDRSGDDTNTQPSEVMSRVGDEFERAFKMSVAMTLGLIPSPEPVPPGATTTRRQRAVHS